MNVSAIFPSGTLDQTNNLQKANQQRQSEFQQLTEALKSGNLTNAQQAIGLLAQSTTNSTTQSAQLTRSLNALGSALQAGDLTGARDAYSEVQQSSQTSRPMVAHHHRPHHGGGGSPLLTSGFPGGSDNPGINAGGQDVFQPLNLTV